jgi:hypothetical protein
MNKLQRLFQSARQERAAQPPPGFAEDVLRMLGAEQPAAAPMPSRLIEQLGALFPRAAVAAALVLLLSLASQFLPSSAPDLETQLSQISEQWLFPL